MGRHLCPFDPFSAEIRASPYAHYRSLRHDHPVCWHPPGGFWVVSRYEHVEALLTDSRCGHWGSGDQGGRLPPRARAITECMELLSPSGSRALRSCVIDRFSARNLASIRDQVEETATSLLAGLADQPHADLRKSFLNPFTFATIAELLGIPRRFAGVLAKLVDILPFPLLALVPLASSPEGLPELPGRLVQVLRAVLASKREERDDDLISDLYNAKDAGEPVSEQVLADTLLFLLYAGHDNIMHFMGNAVVALLQHPDQRDYFAGHPDEAARAVEELMRFDGPVQFIQVVAHQPFELEGQSIAAGENIYLGVASANRDEERFPDPDRLDLTRRASGHLAFGRGPMSCLGASVAQLNATVGLNRLFATYPDLDLASGEALRYKEEPHVLRGLEALPIELGPST